MRPGIMIVADHNPAFNVIVEIKEWVKIERNSVETTAVTWRDGITGFAYESEHVISSLSQLIDEFLNDWYKANPKS